VAEQFEKDWQNPAYTQIELVPVNVNEVLTKHYTTSKPVHFTREMLWDLERLKSWDPRTYISKVVSEGKSWGRTLLENGDEVFVRWSQQRQWMSNDEYASVIEEVYLFNREQRAIFIGRAEVVDDTGKILHASKTQPLFHVEHGVSGTHDCPLNTWRIIHLTTEKDDVLVNKFVQGQDLKTLPEYVENYTRINLGAQIHKKENI